MFGYFCFWYLMRTSINLFGEYALLDVQADTYDMVDYFNLCYPFIVREAKNEIEVAFVII